MSFGNVTEVSDPTAMRFAGTAKRLTIWLWSGRFSGSLSPCSGCLPTSFCRYGGRWARLFLLGMFRGGWHTAADGLNKRGSRKQLRFCFPPLIIARHNSDLTGATNENSVEVFSRAVPRPDACC